MPVQMRSHVEYGRRSGTSLELELPNEMWLVILEHLNPVDLYALGRASRRLNSLLCEFFWQTRVSRVNDLDLDGGTRIELTLTVNVLHRRALELYHVNMGGLLFRGNKRNGVIDDLDLASIVLNPPAIHELTCDFKATCKPADRRPVVLSLSDDYQQLSRFVSRLPAGISHINIGLEEFDHEVYREAAQGMWVARTKILNELFNTCTEKGCSSFQVRDGHYAPMARAKIGSMHFRWEYLIDPLISMTKGTRFIFSEKTTRVGKGWKIISTSPKVEGGLPPPSLIMVNKATQKRVIVASKVTTFGITCPLLALPPFSNWTYQLVATSTHLTTLTISNLNYLGPHFWELALTWLLEALKIQNVLKFLTIESNIPEAVLNLTPMWWFLNELGGGEGVASTPLEELNLVGWVDFGTVPGMVHKKFDGIVRSHTLKRMKVGWEVLLALVGMDQHMICTHEAEQEVAKVLKERFTILETLEIIEDGVVHVLEVK